MKKILLFYLSLCLSFASVLAGTPTVKESILIVLGWIIAWLFVSFCIYLAHGMISSKKVHYGSSLGASLVGSLAVAVTFIVFRSMGMPYIGIIVAIFVWLAVIMSMLDLNFGQSVAVTIVTIIVYIVLVITIAWLFDIPLLSP